MSAEQIYSRFKARSGSDFIASAEAIAGLQSIIGTYRPRSVLEIGSGIGTLTFAIVETYRALGVDDDQFATVENNDFCVRQLRANLARELHRVRMFDDIGGVAGQRFDLIIIDGGAEQDGRFAELLAAGGIIFVEGFRAPQRSLITRLRRSYAVANIRSMRQTDSARQPAGWGGAYWLFKFEPTLSERLHFARRYLWDGVLVTKRRAVKVALRTVLGWIRLRARL
jgi:predicted O-methyltransferase YrrM